MVIIRAGLGTTDQGGELEQALRDVFGALHVGHNLDQYQVVQDIRATR